MSKHTFLRKSVATATSVAVGVMSLAYALGPATAAPVTVSVTTPATGSFAASTDTDVTFGYTASASDFAIGESVTVVISPALPSAVADCATATDDADGDTTTDGAFGGFTTSGATYTFTAASTAATTTGLSLCLNFQNDTTAGMYSISIIDNNDDDVGSALVYVGDENDVQVEAIVAPTLSFVIRDAADAADLANVGGAATGPNLCDLGTLTTGSVSTCDYRLKVATNAANGYSMNIAVDDDLNNAADSEFIDNIAEDSTVTAGTEGYGIAFIGGNRTEDGGTSDLADITESGDFNDDDTPIASGTNTTLYTSPGPNDPDAGQNNQDGTDPTALVTHRAAIDAATPAGIYDQLITYTVSATF